MAFMTLFLAEAIQAGWEYKNWLSI